LAASRDIMNIDQPSENSLFGNARSFCLANLRKAN